MSDSNLTTNENRKALTKKTIRKLQRHYSDVFIIYIYIYTTQFVFLIIRLVPGNVVMVAIDMCGKSPITGEWIYGIT